MNEVPDATVEPLRWDPQLESVLFETYTSWMGTPEEFTSVRLPVGGGGAGSSPPPLLHAAASAASTTRATFRMIPPNGV